MVRVIWRVCSALLLGIIFSIWIIQNNPHVQKELTTKILSTLEKEWDVAITVKQAHINFFACSIYLDHATIKPRNPKKHFSWGFREGKVYISPFKFLKKKKLALYITFNNVEAQTGYNGSSFDLIDHVNDIFATPDTNIPVSIKTVRFNNNTISFKHNKNNMCCRLPGSLFISREKAHRRPGQRLAGNLTGINGTLYFNNKKIFPSINGTLQFFTVKKDGPLCIVGTAQLFAPTISPTAYSLTIEWNPQNHFIKLIDPEKKVDVILKKKDQVFSLQGSLPLKTLISSGNLVTTTPFTCPPVTGTCLVKMVLEQKQTKVGGSGTIIISDAGYKTLTLKKITTDITYFDTEQANINITADVCQGIFLEGLCKANFVTGTARCEVKNSKQIPLNQVVGASMSEWIIVPKLAAISADISTSHGFECTGKYSLRLLSQVTEKEYPYTGTFSVTPTDAHILGITKHGAYTIQGKLKDHPMMTRWFYAGKNMTFVNLVMPEGATTLTGTIHYIFLMSFFPQNLRHIALGNDCICSMSVDQKDYNQITGSVGIAAGRLYIPENRNLIEKFHTNFTLLTENKQLFLDNFEIGFCKGSIKSPHITLQYDSKFNLNLLHIPLQIDNLFINWKKDFYGFIYGNLLLNKIPSNIPKISGTLVLKRTLLRDNMFAEVGSSNVYSPMGGVNNLLQSFAVDLFISNEKPIKVKTATLQTSVNLNTRIQYLPDKDALLTPHVTGSINLDHGYLQFLRNKLFIEYGKIQFIPNQMNDPLIDLIAKNKINRYQITLQATGSLQKPNIILESSPELTEEQILGLIFAGSEHATLQADLPLMLVQNLNNLMLGSNKIFPKKSKIMEKITRPLKYVQIVPSFMDSSGRGGIKGVLSVNVSDQLKAQIQKNFNLQNDFTAQLEYALTDDVNIKVVKDQRDEIGSEVEFRVKL